MFIQHTLLPNQNNKVFLRDFVNYIPISIDEIICGQQPDLIIGVTSEKTPICLIDQKILDFLINTYFHNKICRFFHIIEHSKEIIYNYLTVEDKYIILLPTTKIVIHMVSPHYEKVLLKEFAVNLKEIKNNSMIIFRILEKDIRKILLK